MTIALLNQSLAEIVNLMEQITLNNDYEVPAQACSTFRTVLQLLEQFETDLHTHVFIENHILFPRITDLN